MEEQEPVKITKKKYSPKEKVKRVQKHLKAGNLTQAINLVKENSFSKFDGAMEVILNVIEKGLRGNVTLPHGTGKTIRVKIADDDLISTIENGRIDFDILVAHPSMMPKLAKIAKILGPKGLMPNPKTNTISENPAELVKILSSAVQWKTQPDFPIIHTVIGKVSFETKKLEENFAALIKSVGKEKIKSVFLKPTMGPSIRVQA
ncbi:50S ribosomal protein L1 [Candidatus Gottesmanbacteria bacterium]|nr:50S ribosomal protein L1 [Candidatus Gottesmanbacteria bacterium]